MGRRTRGRACVGESVFLRGIPENLSGNATGGEIDKVLAFQFRFSRRSMEFPDREGGVTRFVQTRRFPLDLRNGTILIDGVQIVAEHGASHVETLLRETFHR